MRPGVQAADSGTDDINIAHRTGWVEQKDDAGGLTRNLRQRRVHAPVNLVDGWNGLGMAWVAPGSAPSAGVVGRAPAKVGPAIP